MNVRITVSSGATGDALGTIDAGGDPAVHDIPAVVKDFTSIEGIGVVGGRDRGRQTRESHR